MAQGPQKLAQFTRWAQGRNRPLLANLRVPGDPVYLLSIIHEHKARKVCYWHVMAELRRIRLKGSPGAGATEILEARSVLE